MPVSETARLEAKIDALASMVADLRVAVARVEERQNCTAPKALARDAALTISGSGLGGAILFLIQHLTK